MFKDIDIVVCSNEQLANEARTGTMLGLCLGRRKKTKSTASKEEGEAK